MNHAYQNTIPDQGHRSSCCSWSPLLAAGIGPRQTFADPLPGTTNDRGVQAVVSFDLYAMTGIADPARSGHGTGVGLFAGAGRPAQVPGPVLIVTQGDTVNVTLHNGLAVPTALYFQGQSMIPDLTGAAPGGTQVYSFVATDPGIYLYEAGLLAGAQYQVPMGLYGALIVRPTLGANYAYNDAATLFDVEAPIVLSEIDPALNNSANPATFDMRNYAAKYFLINGKAYPQTAPIAAAAGQTLLLRYVNAGQQIHTMAVLGLYQQFLSLGGAQLPYYRKLTSELLAAGDTADALLVVPLVAQGQGASTEGINVPPTRFALYEASGLLHNNGAKDANGMPLYGGMLTFINSSADPGRPQGPVASNLALAPNPANGAVNVLLTGSVSDVGRGDNNIQAAEFAIDLITSTVHLMTPVDGTFDSPTEAVQGTIAVADMATLAAGPHTIYVRGQDMLGNWGTYNFVVLDLDKAGPMTSGIPVQSARLVGYYRRRHPSHRRRLGQRQQQRHRRRVPGRWRRPLRQHDAQRPGARRQPGRDAHRREHADLGRRRAPLRGPQPGCPAQLGYVGRRNSRRRQDRAYRRPGEPAAQPQQRPYRLQPADSVGAL